MDEWTDILINGDTVGKIDADEQMDGWTDGRTDVQLDRQMDGPTN